MTALLLALLLLSSGQQLIPALLLSPSSPASLSPTMTTSMFTKAWCMGRNDNDIDKDSVTLERIRKRDDVFTSAALCMDVFFVDDDDDVAAHSRNDRSNGLSISSLRQSLRELLLQQLFSRLSGTMLTSLSNPSCVMIRAVSVEEREVLGYVELSLSAGLLTPKLAKEHCLSPPRLDRERFNPPPKSLDFTYGGRQQYPKLANLAVAKNARGRGIGRKLVNSCIQQAARWGYRDLLLTVEPSNENAVRFYTSLGFNKIIAKKPGLRFELGGLWLRQVPAPLQVMRIKFDGGCVGEEEDELCAVEDRQGHFLSVVVDPADLDLYTS